MTLKYGAKQLQNTFYTFYDVNFFVNVQTIHVKKNFLHFFCKMWYFNTFLLKYDTFYTRHKTIFVMVSAKRRAAARKAARTRKRNAANKAAARKRSAARRRRSTTAKRAAPKRRRPARRKAAGKRRTATKRRTAKRRR